jgi:membrane-bound metal-dependent hydrolase YbcI (DUF457 family)
VPTPVAHSLAGAGIFLATGTRSPRRDGWLFVFSVIAACVPDIDFGISFLAGQNYHHYFTHSVGFNMIFAAASYGAARLWRRERPLRDAAILSSAYLSHLLLDMLSKDTAAPFGIELFWPLSSDFYISPVLVFDDIWRGTLAKLFGLHNWLAVAREVAIVGPFVAGIWWWRTRKG